jgi:hypothetical protein
MHHAAKHSTLKSQRKRQMTDSERTIPRELAGVTAHDDGTIVCWAVSGEVFVIENDYPS